MSRQQRISRYLKKLLYERYKPRRKQLLGLLDKRYYKKKLAEK
jgi:hypothetical protein